MVRRITRSALPDQVSYGNISAVMVMTFHLRTSIWLLGGLFLLTITSSARAVEPGELQPQFEQTVRPFLGAYCLSCHNSGSPAAQLDLSRYDSLESAAADHRRWEQVRTRLAAQEMPPAGVVQPDQQARELVVEWVDAMLKQEAQKNAGDPGMILARRLNNAEYNYTIRDLTGVDLRPAREFPVDPANSAGFDNSGETLTMSPSLFDKYLQAARETANHAVFKPGGMEFSPYPMLVETDQDKYCITQIIDFYHRQNTDYSDYFQTAWRYKHRAALGNPQATLEQFAAEYEVSPKYLATIWKALETTPEEVGPLAKLQGMWRELPAPQGSQPNLARDDADRMRDYVTTLRKKIEPRFYPLKIPGIGATSQPFHMWKNRQYATHRRTFDHSALQVAGEARELPSAEGLNGEEALIVEHLLAREGDLELQVPTGQRERYEAAFERFSSIFPDAFYVAERGRYYLDPSKDQGRLLSAGFHNLMGYFRDDAPLYELILDEQGQQELNAMWLEMDTVASVAHRTFTQFYLNESGEARGNGRESEGERPGSLEITSEPIIRRTAEAYLAKATASGNRTAIRAIEGHFDWVNETIRNVERVRTEAEPRHLQALLVFARRAYRRPLTKAEGDNLLAFYRELRERDGLNHERAMRDCLTRVLMSLNFLYRVDLAEAQGTPASAATPISDYSLASRLSYFLWSSTPDETLLAHAEAGDLHQPEVIASQSRRMLRDPRAQGLATEFGGNWLDFRRFEQHNAVDRERFPSFNDGLREAMFQEPIRFLSDVIAKDRPILDLLYADRTFVNAVLAKHYGMSDLKTSGDEWVEVQGASRYGRGGLLPMSVFLTMNAPGLRTSPVKRGYWIVRRVLGEQIPPPPAVVPELPRDEAQMDLPLREMLARHRENPACASCHARFDSFGLAFEGYGPVGEKRTEDLAGRAVENIASFAGGEQAVGFTGVRDYIRGHRQDDFVDNLCRKLLVFSLGRMLLLSDEPLIDEMKSALTANDYRISALVDRIVTSPQFLMKRAGGDSGQEGNRYAQLP